jgi:2,4-dienoyl-CoA reductase-like NADH-dependent reductase (Old Yellow Enzyme family)
MKTVFEPFKLAGITFSNKIIRSATFEGLGDENGKPTDQLIKKYEALAKGGVGGIITGFIGVGQQGKASDNMVMINKDKNIEILKKLTKRMHEMETPIIAQLNHCGGQSKEESAHMPIVAPYINGRHLNIL